MTGVNLTELPLPILTNVCSYCDRESVLNLGLCSKEWRNHLAPILFQSISFPLCQINQGKELLPLEHFTFTKSLAINRQRLLSEEDSFHEWECYAPNSQLIINSLDPFRLKDISFDKLFNRHHDDSILNLDLIFVFRKFFSLTTVKLTNLKRVSREIFLCLGRLKYLKTLHLRYCGVTDEDFSNILTVDIKKSMEELLIEYVKVTESSLNYISKMKRLRK